MLHMWHYNHTEVHGSYPVMRGGWFWEIQRGPLGKPGRHSITEPQAHVQTFYFLKW